MMMRRSALALFVTAALVAVAPVRAQSFSDLQPIPASQQAIGQTPAVSIDDGLQPGEFQWFGSGAGDGSLVVMVSLADQRATVYRNGERVAVTTVSTGMPGRETPTGVYPILQKEKMHHSNLYNDAPMPFMQRLTWDGVALHAGRIPGHPASHGCVRLPKEFAQQLFAITERGQTVIISDDTSVAAMLRAGAPEFLANQIGRGDAGSETMATREADPVLDGNTVSYQDSGASSGGSPK
jgi:hypothetical protein